MSDIREPSSEECEKNARVRLNDDLEGFAIWYPQMGGYCSKAVVVADEDCFNVYVWHDGEFPFSEDQWHDGPLRLHHCDATQFVEFGQTVARLLSPSDS